MNRISLKNIKLKAYTCFVNEQETGLLPTSGLIGIRGKNLDTGGSSGAGKSSFVSSIAFALGFSASALTELQSFEWLTDEKLQVELELETHHGPAILRRGNVFFLRINGQEIKGGAKEKEKALSELIGVSCDFRQALTYREQKQPSLILSMTDSNKKEFLSQLLGLQELEDQIEAYNKKANEYTKVVSEKDITIKTLSSQLVEPERPNFESKSQINDSLVQKHFHLKELTESISKVELTLKKEQNDFESIQNTKTHERLQQLTEHFKAEDQKSTERLKAVENEIKDLDQKLKESIDRIVVLSKKELELSGLEKEVEKVDKEIQGIENYTCPTCGQSWFVKNDEKEKLHLHRNILQDQLTVCFTAQDLLQKEEHIGWEFKAELEKKKELKNFIISDKKDKKAAFELETWRVKNESGRDFASKFSTIVQGLDDEKKELEQTKFSIKLLEAKLIEIDKQNALKEKHFNELAKKYDTLKGFIDKHQADKDKFSKLYDQELDYIDLLRKFLGIIFEEVLNEIANEANECLKHLPNVATTTIQFATERTTLKGIIRQEIRPIINRDGHQMALGRLSGGQDTAVELAVDLALGKVIGRRTGTFLGWIILDEPFTGLDTISREACLEVLKYAANDRLIMIIDHSVDTAEMFDGFINLTSSNEVSTISKVLA